MTRLTIGIPTCNDYDGLWPTLTDLQLTQDEQRLADSLDILVVSQSDDPEHLKKEKSHVGSIPNARYIHYPKPQGAGPAKQAVFDNARGDAVCCIDSHVLLGRGVLARMIDFSGMIGNNLYFGPNLKGRLVNADGSPAFVGTHYTDSFGSNGNFGTWQTFPEAKDPDHPPIEITTASGTGLFLAKRSTFPGFHPDFRGHGGIEPYICAKYRQLGRTSWCLPWMRWVHRYGYVDGCPYEGHQWRVKAANYLIDWREVRYPRWEQIVANFTAKGRLPLADFNKLAIEMGAMDKAAPQPPKAALPKPRGAPTVITSQLETGEADTLGSLPCRYRTRVSGKVLCNVGCPSMQATPVTTWDCKRHGLVTLGKRRTDLKNCLHCTDRKE